MPKPIPNDYCVSCGEGPLERKMISTEFAVRGDMIQIEYPVLSCSSCGMGILEAGSHPSDIAFAMYRCRNCGEVDQVLEKIDYDAEVLYHGVLYKFTIVDLELPVCQVCGERTFTKDVDDQITTALHKHLEEV